MNIQVIVIKESNNSYILVRHLYTNTCIYICVCLMIEVF